MVTGLGGDARAADWWVSDQCSQLHQALSLSSTVGIRHRTEVLMTVTASTAVRRMPCQCSWMLATLVRLIKMLNAQSTISVTLSHERHTLDISKINRKHDGLSSIRFVDEQSKQSVLTVPGPPNVRSHGSAHQGPIKAHMFNTCRPVPRRHLVKRQSRVLSARLRLSSPPWLLASVSNVSRRPIMAAACLKKPYDLNRRA